MGEVASIRVNKPKKRRVSFSIQLEFLNDQSVIQQLIMDPFLMA